MLKYLLLLARLPRWHMQGRSHVENAAAVTLGWLTRGRYLPKEIILRNGWRIGLSGHPHDAITAFVVFFKQDYSPPPPAAAVLDAGANIGCYALYCLLHGARRVECVEASQATLAVLRANIDRNALGDLVTCHHRAVWSSDSETLFIGVRSSPHNKLIDKADAQSEPVSTITLDTLLALDADPNWHVKLDIEGAEAAALEGLRGAEKVARFDIEFHNVPGLAAARRLQDRGFAILECEQDRPTIGIIKLRRVTH